MSLRAALVGVIGALGMAGLASRTTSAPAVVQTPIEDAGVEAATPDVPFALVAEGSPNLQATKTSDGRIVFFDGPMLWEARPEGTLAEVMPPSETAKLIPDDDNVVGYTTTKEIHAVRGALGGVLLIDVFGEGASTMAFKAGKLAELPLHEASPRTAFAHRGHLVVWDYSSGRLNWADGADLPPLLVPAGEMIDPTRTYEGPEGSLVAFVSRAGEYRARRLLVWTREAAPMTVEFPPDETGCDVVTSFADRFVLECGMKAYALDGNRFVLAYNRTSPYMSHKASEDPAQWMYIASENTIARCPPRGECTSREIPRVGPRTPSYLLWPTEFVEREGSRNWYALAFETPSSEATYPNIERVLARGPNDVWVLVRAERRTQVFHTSAAPATPKVLPNAVSARVAIRNTRPPARWTGPCDQVYVRLGSNAEAIVQRKPEIQAALGVNDTGIWFEPFTWALVEGTLGDQRGVGVVLARRSPAQKLELLENAVRKLVKAFATGPANEPPVYCTLPVLERKLLGD